MSSDLTHLTGLVTQYATARAALVAHPDFEAGCPPDRLYHARDDAAVEVAEAVTRLLAAQMAQDSPVGLSPAAHHDPTQQPAGAVEHMRVQDAIGQRLRDAGAGYEDEPWFTDVIYGAAEAVLSAGRPAAGPDEVQEHFLDANERMGAALVEIGMALGLPRPGVNATWGVPEILAKIAEGAAADRAGGDAPASWVARITGPCWVVDGNDGWEQPHYPGSFAAVQAAQRDAAEDGTDPRPIRQLDRECWAAARDGRLVEDDDLGLVHHCTEGDARAAAGPAGDDTAPTAEPVSGSFDVDRLHPFHRN